MTVVTKPLNDNKQDQLKKPLVADGELPQGDAVVDLPGEPTFSAPRSRSLSTLLLCFRLSVVFLGVLVLSGLFLYHYMDTTPSHKMKGWIQIPSPDADELIQEDNLHSNSGFDLPKGFIIREQIKVDLIEDIENIYVPDFGNGREGRFIHDFKYNKTGILDISGRRCFVMPLNRSQILAPRSLYDLTKKMLSGYYNVDTKVVRETYQVELPPTTDIEDMGHSIFDECDGLPTYRLLRVTERLFKRELSDSELFSQFAGKKIEFQILMGNLKEYEKSN